MSDPSIASLRDALRAFAKERDWDQFHSPKNLAMALSVEVAEIVEHFQWLDDAQSRALASAKIAEVGEELGDVLICLVQLADKLGLDLLEEARRKLEANRTKYPADRVRGSAKKYTEYG